MGNFSHPQTGVISHANAVEACMEMARQQENANREDVYDLVLNLFGRDGLNEFKERYEFQP